MKLLLKLALSFFFLPTVQAQTKTTMTSSFISTKIGQIAIQTKWVKNTTPIIFLHGVYFDHNLWNYQSSRIKNRSVITIDMPLHGNSRQTTAKWTLEDGAAMLLEVMDSLAIDRCVAIGHSWGSMTIIRAIEQQPERFVKVGLCNLPFEASTPKMIRQFKAQHWILPFRKFYTKQVAKAIYGKKILANKPSLLSHLEKSMGMLSNKDIKTTDYTVIIHQTDKSNLLKKLPVVAFALKGKEDYVPTPPANIPTKIVDGGHVSPLEAPEVVWQWLESNLLK